MTEKRRLVTDLEPEEARAFFLKHESYCNLDLPNYITFNDLLTELSDLVDVDFETATARSHDDVNHTILTIKSGTYSWRPIALIHPAIYVTLVNHITEKGNWELICSRFRAFQSHPRLRCLSIPGESLTTQTDKAAQIHWWYQEIEQKSIELALDYEIVVRTDVADCYPSIYTHSIPWSLHTKSVAKSKRQDLTMIGNRIDKCIQDMHHGQTNGIAQGSALMDFIAEMILGYADVNLIQALSCQNIADYHILRFRDDYRIFVNSKMDGEMILKCLAEVMIELGLQLSPAKTGFNSDVIRSSIKSDRLEWILRPTFDEHWQTQLLMIHDHSNRHPGSGSISKALTDYYERLSLTEDDPANFRQLISIVVDIAYSSPGTYPICTAILSRLIRCFSTSAEKLNVVSKILHKFRRIPITGHLELWLQRISVEFGPDIDFNEGLCRQLGSEDVRLWNSDWITDAYLKDIINCPHVIDRDQFYALDPVVSLDEVRLFRDPY